MHAAKTHVSGDISVVLRTSRKQERKDDDMNRDLDLRPRSRRPSVKLALAAALAGAVASGYPLPAYALTTATLATNATAPRGGVVLVGSNGSAHYWSPDHLLGLCRLDPDATSATGFSLNRNTCVLFVNGKQLKVTQVAHDPATNFVYTPDMSSRGQGVVRLHYDPTLDGGNGGMSIFGRHTFGAACFGKQTPWGAAMGPDGNLYVSFKASPNIDRVVDPHLSPQCANVEVVGNASDGKSAFALAFLGNDLWEVDNRGMGVIGNAVDPACTGGACDSSGLFTGQVVLPTALTADPLNGVLYVGAATEVYAVDIAHGSGPVPYQSGFTFVFGLAIDPTTVALGTAPTLFGGDDPSRGVLPLSGFLFRL
jgi:hypothetical protein